MTENMTLCATRTYPLPRTVAPNADYMAEAAPISAALVDSLTEPEITEEMYEELNKIMEEIHNEQEKNSQ